MKKSLFAITLLLAGFGMMSCDEDSSPSPGNSEDPKSFSSLCVNSGGTLENGRCVCGGVTCDAGDLCNAETKACPVRLNPDQFHTACTESGGTPDGSFCTCGGEKCAAWQLCVSNKCPEPAKPDFSQLCSYTGGEVSGSVCKCNGVDCGAGVLCNTVNGKCSTEPAPAVAENCTNDEDGVGQLRVCDGGNCTTKPCELEDGAQVSCKSDGSACGDCLDYVSSCENNDDGVGVVSMCRGGQKSQLFECDGGHSCLKKDCADTGCANEVLCGECHEGEFVCKNGNVPENTRLETYDGFIDVPAGTITGMRSKCIDGQWTQLALDDHENCYFGYLNSNKNSEDFAKYPQITVNTRQIVTVWNYDSNGLDSTKYSLAACADDGVNCGECAYSFSYCSGDKWYSCNEGRVLELPCQYSDNNGNVGCYAGNSCYGYSTDGYCKGTSCQNCKSICNW